MEKHSRKVLESLGQKHRKLQAELELVAAEVETLQLKDSFNAKLNSSGSSFFDSKNQKHNSAASGYFTRVALYRDLEKRVRRNQSHVTFESKELQDLRKEVTFENIVRKRGDRDRSNRAAKRNVVTVVGGGRARAQFHITEEIDFESLLDDVCLLWGGLVSANYRLVANYATSVEYFEKGLYRPNDNVYSCLKVLSNDEERGYGCAGTKPFNQLPRLYLQYSPPEDVAEAVMANPKKQKLVFNRYDVDESGSIDVFEFQKIMKEHLNVSPDEEWFLRNLFSKYAVNEELSFDSFMEVIASYTTHQRSQKRLRVGLTPKQAFEYFDRDHANSISLQSFMSTLQAADETLDASECEDLFNELDPGGTQVLPYRAFERGWETIKASVLDKARDRVKTPMQILKEEFNLEQPDTRTYKYIPDKEKKIIKSFCFFMLFLLTFVSAMVFRRDIRRHFFVKLAVDDLINSKTFGSGSILRYHDISDIDQILTFLDTPLKSVVFKSGYEIRNSTRDRDGMLLMSNKLTPWTVRIRQVRVRASSCVFSKQKESKELEGIDDAACFENYGTGLNRECGCLRDKPPVAHKAGEPFGMSRADILESQCYPTDLDCLENTVCSKLDDCGTCATTGSCVWCKDGGEGKCVGGCSNVAKCDSVDCSCSGQRANLPSSAFKWDPTPVRRAVGPALQMATQKGAIGVYDGTGYVIDLDNNITKWAETIAEMRRSQWIDDKRTRAVIVSFLIYNGNYNYYLNVNMVMELSPAGSVQAHISYHGMQIDMYNSDPEKYVGFVDSFMSTAAIGLIFYQSRILALHREAYANIMGALQSMPKSTYLDLSICVAILITQLLRLTLYSESVRVEIATTVGPPKEYTDIGIFMELYNLQFQLDMIVLLGLAVRMIKYLRIHGKIKIFMQVIYGSLRAVQPFFVIFVILMWAYANLGHQLFGSSVHGYRSTRRGIVTLLLMNVGVYNYDELTEANPAVAPLFFVSYFMFITLVMGNMFMVIINDVYLVFYRDARRYNVDNRTYHWRSILGIFIPAFEVQLLDLHKEELAKMGEGGRQVVGQKNHTIRVARGIQDPTQKEATREGKDARRQFSTKEIAEKLGRLETKELEREGSDALESKND
jgi:Ca2+-binding EF-hand superfamily protein